MISKDSLWDCGNPTNGVLSFYKARKKDDYFLIELATGKIAKTSIKPPSAFYGYYAITTTITVDVRKYETILQPDNKYIYYIVI